MGKRGPKPGTPRAAKGAKPVEHDRPGASATLTDEQRQALFLQAVIQCEKAEAKHGEAKSEMGNAYKRAKADGFSAAKIKQAIADKKRSADEIRAEMKGALDDRLETLRWLAIPVGTQTELFGEPDRTPSVDKARAEGKVAGMEGADAKPPYSVGSPQGRDWMDGWHEGQAIVSKGFKQAPPTDDFDEFAPPAVDDGQGDHAAPPH